MNHHWGLKNPLHINTIITWGRLDVKRIKRYTKFILVKKFHQSTLIRRGKREITKRRSDGMKI